MIRGFLVSENTSKLKLGRPLGPGEILDRALAVLASRWKSILVLVAAAVLPGALLHYYVSSEWVLANFPRNSFDFQGVLRVAGEREGIASPYASLSVGAYEVLTFIAAGACAAIVAQAFVGQRRSVSDGLRSLSERWMTAGPAVILAAVAVYSLDRTFASILGRLYPMVISGTMNPLLFIVLSRYLSPLVFTPIYHLVRLVGISIVSASVLEACSLGGSIWLGLSSILHKQRLLVAVLFSLAFTFLYFIFDQLAIGAPLVLLVTRSPIADTLYDVLDRVVPLSIVIVSAIVFYLDSRLRQGVNVPEDFVARLELESIAEV